MQQGEQNVPGADSGNNKLDEMNDNLSLEKKHLLVNPISQIGGNHE